MIQTQQMQDRGMKIIQMNSIDSSLVTHFIGLTVAGPSANATSGQPSREAVGIVIPAWLSTQLGDR